MTLTREQWNAVSAVIPDPMQRAERRGRPWRDARSVLEGILWVLKHDATWKQMPDRFPPHQTCHRRFRQWTEDGTMSRIIVTLIADLEERAGVSLRWMLHNTPNPEQYSSVLESELGGRGRGRPGWRQNTLETLLSQRMARYLRDEAGWPGNIDTQTLPQRETVNAAE